MTDRPDELPAPSATTLLVVAGAPVGLIVLVLLVLVQPVVAVVLAAAAWASVSAVVRVRAGRIILDRVGGVRPDLSDPALARLDSLLGSVAAATGVPKPACLVIDDPAPDALVAGQGPRDVTFVVTRGLVDRLDRLQLEAVVAHQLVGVRSQAARSQSVGTAVAARELPWMRLGPLDAWTGRALTTGALGTLERDAAAVGVTRFPPALLGALEVAAARPPVTADPTLAPLWWLPPDRAHLDLRLDHLRELT